MQDTYPYTGIAETNAAGLQACMAAARAEGTSAIGRITDVAAAMGVPIDPLVVEDHQAAKGIVDAAQSCRADLIVMGSHGRSDLATMVSTRCSSSMVTRCSLKARKVLDDAGRPCRTHVLHGEPATDIVRVARSEGVDLIVMGTRGMGALGNLVLGSTATKVVHLADTPVTLVK